MAMIPILNQHNGPLPISVNFKSPTDRGAMISVCGSLRSTGAPTLIGFQALVDGRVMATSHIWSNVDDIHRATVMVVFKGPEDFNSHTLTLQVLNNHSIGDQNDFFTALLDY